jgi:hypothetical protein
MSRLGDFPQGGVALFTPPTTPGRTLEGFDVKRRGKLTYYSSKGEAAPVLSALVTEEQADGDLRIYLSGLTGGFSAYNTLGLSELAAMDPEQEVPLVFRCWERCKLNRSTRTHRRCLVPGAPQISPDRLPVLTYTGLQLAGVCDSICDIDFIEMHAFAGQPKSPSPLADPAGYAAELQRLRAAYSSACKSMLVRIIGQNGAIIAGFRPIVYRLSAYAQ